MATVTTIGTATMVWAEANYLSLVAQQVAIVPGPHLLLWSQSPWQWLSDAPIPFQDPATNPVAGWLRTDPNAETFEVVKLAGGPRPGADDLALELETRNHALDVLAKRRIDVCCWLDSDYLLTLSDMHRIIDTIQAHPARSWSVPASHYWRSFQQCHAVSPARIATTTATRYPETFNEPDALIEDAHLHHASYVLSDDEVLRKFSSWGHAGLAKQQEWARRWMDHDDAVWNPIQAPRRLPDSITLRMLELGLERVVR